VLLVQVRGQREPKLNGESLEPFKIVGKTHAEKLPVDTLIRIKLVPHWREPGYSQSLLEDRDQVSAEISRESLKLRHAKQQRCDVLCIDVRDTEKVTYLAEGCEVDWQIINDHGKPPSIKVPGEVLTECTDRGEKRNGQSGSEREVCHVPSIGRWKAVQYSNDKRMERNFVSSESAREVNTMGTFAPATTPATDAPARTVRLL
jgi:hypothetical protein